MQISFKKRPRNSLYHIKTISKQLNHEMLITETGFPYIFFQLTFTAQEGEAKFYFPLGTIT